MKIGFHGRKPSFCQIGDILEAGFGSSTFFLIQVPDLNRLYGC